MPRDRVRTVRRCARPRTLPRLRRRAADRTSAPVAEEPPLLAPPRVSPHNVAVEPIPRAVLRLQPALGDSAVLTDHEKCAPYANDESEAEGITPPCVVHART